MKIKVTLKSVSIILVLAMLLSTLPALTVFADDTATGYYNTAASLDYERANPLTSKIEGVSVTTLNNDSTGYLHASPQATANAVINSISGLTAGSTYTFKIDYYVLEYSDDSNGTLAAFFLEDNTPSTSYVFQEWVNKSSANLDQWYTFEKTFDCESAEDKFARIYAYGGSNIIYDNLRIIDQDGTTVFDEDFETQNRTLSDGFSYVRDYNTGTADAYDKGLHLAYATEENTTGAKNVTVGGDTVGVDSATTQYTLSFDYMILKKHTKTGDSDVFDLAFGLDSYCLVCQDADGHKPKNAAGEQSQWYYGEADATNIWYSANESFTMSACCTNVYARVYVYSGAEVLINNIKVTSSDGTVVMDYDMDGNTLSGNRVTNSSCTTTELVNLNGLVWCNDVPDTAHGHLRADVTNLAASYKQIDITFTSSETVASDSYPFVTFDYRLSGTPNTTNGVAVAVSFNDNTSGDNTRKFVTLTDTDGKWKTTGKLNFTGLDIVNGENTLNLLVYGGICFEIDNIKVYQQNGTLPIATINFAAGDDGALSAENGAFIEESDERVFATDDYAFLADNSNGTGDISYTSNQIGQPYPITTAGTYTVEFDFYALSAGNQIVSFVTIDSGWGNIEQYYTDQAGFIENEWVTISFTTTASKDISFWRMYLGAGVKGYIDNVRFIDSNGNEVVNYGMSENENGKTVTGVGSVVELPYEIYAAKKSGDYAFLADNSNGTGDISYTSNQIGQPYPITTAGTYTVEFDFYALSAGNQIVSFVTIDSGWGNIEQYYTDQAGFIENEWVTISFTTTASKDISFWRMYLGAGVKGYIDNVRFIDSNGNEVVNYGMSENENGKTVTGVGSVVELPYEIYLTKTSGFKPYWRGDNYDISYVCDGEGIETYGSNGVLRITAGTAANVYSLNSDTIGYTLTTGTKYRLSFYYRVLDVASSGNGYNVAVLRANDSESDQNQYITSKVPTDGSASYEFTAKEGGIALHVYPGARVAFDNILLEEYVEVSDDSARPAELAAQKYVSGADTYIDVTVSTVTSDTEFSFNLSYDSNVQYVTAKGTANSSVTATDNGSSISAKVESTDKFLWYTYKITGELAVFTFKVCDEYDGDTQLTLTGFDGLLSDGVTVKVGVNTIVTTFGAMRHSDGSIAFGMQLADAGGESINGATVTQKGFIAAIGYHLDAALALDSRNPYVKTYTVSEAQTEGDGYNLYTLQITDPDGDYPVAVRPYAVTESGTYYGEEVAYSANALQGLQTDEWALPVALTGDAALSIADTTAQTWQGANAISQGFIYTNGYTDAQIATELERIDDMDIQMVRSYYDQSFSAVYDADNKSISYNWDTDEMKGLVKWITAMKDRGVEVALNMSWGVNDAYVNHCTTYDIDSCDHDWTVENAQNPFWCVYNQVDESTAIAAYGDWVAASMKYLVTECGLTNVKYLIMFTEPKQTADYPQQWTKYQSLVKSANDALTTAGIRNNFKMVGPNISLINNSYAAQLGESDADYISDMDDILPLIKDYTDIYSFHFYAPNWPADGVTAEDPTDNNYEKYAKHFNQIISTINQYDSGADFWLDEWNYGGQFIDNEYYATQLAQAVVAALNSGVENVMLWQLFETKWPDRENTSGEFENGVHAIGLAPSLTESETPYDVYYAYSLLTKYMGKRGATVYKGTGDNGVYTAMIENEDGTQSILVVNTNQSAKTVNITVAPDVNGTLLRHMYDPATVHPTADAVIIAADKAIDNASDGITDIIPAGAVVVYTTDANYTP